MQHRTVADSEPGCGIGRVEDGADFLHRKMPNQPLVMAFIGDGVDLPHLRQSGGQAKLHVPDEGFNSGESSVARGGGVAALLLEVGEKIEDQRGIDLFKGDLRGLDPQPLAGKNEQEPKGVGVSLARVRTATLLGRHVFS